MPAQPQTVAKATLTALPSGQPVTVHFNPSTLTYTVENSVSQQSGSPKKVQYVAQFSGKLSMDLQFDTTGTGTDVRIDTNQVAAFMQASANASAAAQTASGAAGGGGSNAQSAPSPAPPVLSFQWGSYEFKGVMESFKETIDFFSADGIALRALVSVTLARQDSVFDEGANFSQANTAGSLVPTGDGDSALSVATRGGDPSAMRQLGSDNGLESLRFTGGVQLQVGASVGLSAGAGFASASSGGVQLSAQSGSGALFGSGASAGVAASAGAFAGLQSGRTTASSTNQLDPTRIIGTTVGTDVTAYAGASFSLGGQAGAGMSAGLSSDTGAKFSFTDRLAFDTDD
ncbi:MAG: hypothetical protein WB615_01470 [Candidatus Tumulicola sp.]